MTQIQGLRAIDANELQAVHGGFSLGGFLKKVGKVLTGASAGAAAGSKYGTVGAIVGGVIGAIGGLF
jgi:methylthioribose-1-phosphate isomerase